MCYNMAAKLTPMAIFAMVGRPLDHQAVYELTSHSIVLELTRFIGSSLLEITKASYYIGFRQDISICHHRVAWMNIGYGPAFVIWLERLN